MPTSNIDLQKQILVTEETTPGTTPNNPTFDHTGATELNESETLAHEEIRVLGSFNLYADIIMGKTDTVEILYYPYDTKMIRRGILYSGTGTNEVSVSILKAAKINGVVYYKLAQGCYTTGLTLNIAKVYTVSQSFRAFRITNWMTQAQLDTLIGTTPVYPSPLAAVPYTNLSSQTTPGVNIDPFLLNSVVIDIDTMSVSWAWTMMEKTPLGNFDPKNLRPGNLSITMSFTTWEEKTEIIGDMRTFLAMPATYKLWEGSPDCILTIAGFKANDYKTAVTGGASEFTKETFGGTILTAGITAIP